MGEFVVQVLLGAGAIGVGFVLGIWHHKLDTQQLVDRMMNESREREAELRAFQSEIRQKLQDIAAEAMRRG